MAHSHVLISDDLAVRSYTMVFGSYLVQLPPLLRLQQNLSARTESERLGLASSWILMEREGHWEPYQTL